MTYVQYKQHMKFVAHTLIVSEFAEHYKNKHGTYCIHFKK